jgi:tetratricopeptide (TPR) repeat protein
MLNITILKRSAIFLPLLLLACAHAPQPIRESKLVTVVEAEPDADSETEAEPQPQAVATPVVLPKLELTGPMFYDFLLGDVANQRGRPELAAQIYWELANDTQDPRVAQRAAKLAFDAHQMDKAVEALKLWLKLEPASSQARQMLATLLLSGGRLEDARPYLVEMLAANPGQAGHAFTQTYQLLARLPDKDAAFNLLHELAQPYPKVVEAHLVLAQTAAAAGKRERALEEVRQARALQPDLERAAMLEAQLLQPSSPGQALAVLKKFLAVYPAAGEARLFYARMLLEQKQYPQSREEFQQLLDAHPESADLAFAVAMLSLEMGELDRAETELRQALVKGKRDESTVYYYLGQLGEARKHDDDALQNYRQVKEGEYAYSARLRMAYLLQKAGKLEEAREALHQTVAQNNQERVQLLLIEAQLLRDAKQPDAAYQVLAAGLEKLPKHPELLYETAMLAEQVGKRDIFEQLMRRVIEVKPDHAQAYNALGYSLLERNERLQEGMQLVEKASQLLPNDAGIIDSVGWGYYRLGNLSKSLEFLQRAYGFNPDPEIAAHLGEVLWVQGEKEKAKKIWGEAQKSHPDNAVLQTVIKKFQP